MTLLHRPLFFCLLPFLTFGLTTGPAFAAEDENTELPYVKIKQARDFTRLARLARHQDRIIMLEISGSDCGYCELLEEDFIKPMLRSGDYGHVIIRKLDRDGTAAVIDFSGNKVMPDAFARSYKVSLTPTLLFLDAQGREVAERIIGYNTPELFGGYLDNALEAGIRRIRSR